MLLQSGPGYQGDRVQHFKQLGRREFITLLRGCGLAARGGCAAADEQDLSDRLGGLAHCGQSAQAPLRPFVPVCTLAHGRAPGSCHWIA